jgi:bifunctional N-acetylglucosamine-1-phosphate-uridyltransferase/glucosamine-1-phosphate-acetyltransferase GlmU-like protein
MSISENLTSVSLADFVTDRGAPFPVDPTHEFSEKAPAGVPLPENLLSSFHKAVSERDAVCVLLAAGQGSRFKAPFPKVIHPFAGKPLAQHALDATSTAEIPAVVVVGHAREAVCKALDASKRGGLVTFVVQEEQMGTGHAVFLAKFALPHDFKGDIVIMYADNPGVDNALLEKILKEHDSNKVKYGDNYGALILTGSRSGATDAADAYGRIVRASKSGGTIVDIVEKKTIKKLSADGKDSTYGSVTWTPDELNDLDEFNSGIVVARADCYLKVLGSVVASQTKVEPPKYEYYATDFVKGMVADGFVVEGWTVPVDDMWKLEGTNTLEELVALEAKQSARRALAENGEKQR